MRIVKILFLSILIFSQVGICHAESDEQFIPRDLKECGAEVKNEDFSRLCKETLSISEIVAAKSRVAEDGFLFKVEGDSLFVAAKIKKENIKYAGKPFICCEIQAYLESISEDIYGAKFRWNHMSDAMLSLRFVNLMSTPEGKFEINGSKEFFMEEKFVGDELLNKNGIKKMEDSILINKDVGYRKVTIIKGYKCIDDIEKCIVIYMPDGHSLVSFVENSVRHNIGVDDFIFVGVHNDPFDVINSRINELLFDYDPIRYKYFMEFVTNDLLVKIEDGKKPIARFVAGYSNGGAWALDVLFEKNRIFDGAIVMSPAQWKSKSSVDLKNHSVFIGSGTMEFVTYPKTKAITIGLVEKNASVMELYPPSGHSMNTWLNIWNGSLIGINKLFYK